MRRYASYRVNGSQLLGRGVQREENAEKRLEELAQM